jgi:hypothetical protein
VERGDQGLKLVEIVDIILEDEHGKPIEKVEGKVYLLGK